MFGNATYVARHTSHDKQKKKLVAILRKFFVKIYLNILLNNLIMDKKHNFSDKNVAKIHCFEIQFIYVICLLLRKQT